MDRVRLRQIIKEELSRVVSEGQFGDDYEPTGTSDGGPATYYRSGALKGLESPGRRNVMPAVPKEGPTFSPSLTEPVSVNSWNRQAETHMSYYGGKAKQYQGAVRAYRPVPSKTKGPLYHGEYTLNLTEKGYVGRVVIEEIGYDEVGRPAETPLEALKSAADLLSSDYGSREIESR